MSMRVGKAKVVTKKKNPPSTSSSSYNGYGRSEEGHRGSIDVDVYHFNVVKNNFAKDTIHIEGSSTLAFWVHEIEGSKVMVSTFRTSRNGFPLQQHFL
ncbi:hypothetical protein SUGI_0841030 [Cryptomeria japonica]|nr:hypothetical protein SUGI_0841030 [Cryptomeria japonica]